MLERDGNALCLHMLRAVFGEIGNRLDVVGQRAGVHDLVIGIRHVHHGSEVHVEAQSLEEARLLQLGLFHLLQTAGREDIARRVIGVLGEGAGAGNGGLFTALLLRGEDRGDLRAGAEIRQTLPDLVLCLVQERAALEQIARQSVVDDIRGAGIEIGADADDELTGKLFVGHVLHVGLCLLIVGGEDTAVRERIDRRSSRLGGSLRAHSRVLMHLSRCLIVGLLRGMGHVDIVLERKGERAAGEQQQDDGNNHKLFHCVPPMCFAHK